MKTENKASNTPGNTSPSRGCVLKQGKQSTASEHRDASFSTLPILAPAHPATSSSLKLREEQLGLLQQPIQHTNSPTFSG